MSESHREGGPRPVKRSGNRGKWLLVAAGVLGLLAAYEYFSLPERAQIVRLRTVNPRMTALMSQRMREAGEKGRRLAIRQEWIPLREISSDLVHAVIVAEDGAFYDHEGIDWFEVREAIKKDIGKGKFARGASTITQQLAKNLFLSTSKDPIRKIKEFVITGWLEDELSKERILELYLNVIEWGDGLFGAQAAAHAYFGKDAGALTKDEAARLASVIPNPVLNRPDSGSRYVLRRTNIILLRMEAREW
jgi:monofunctional biosynthetic peptidoglycan transglycosylase